MAQCPVCGSEVDEHSTTCSSCGGHVPGATESFEPVAVPEQVSGDVVESEAEPMLFVRKGPEVGDRFYIDRPRLTIGRDPESDIFLNDVTVSRTHAVLERVGDEITVRDAGSLNGTYLNDIIVDAAQLGDKDVLQIGTFQMIFYAGGGS